MTSSASERKREERLLISSIFLFAVEHAGETIQQFVPVKSIRRFHLFELWCGFELWIY